jgi:hypothetical protein
MESEMTITNGYTTLDDFKSYLFPTGNAGDDEDMMIEAAIESASRAIDAYCGRRFYADTTTTARVFYATDPFYLSVDDFSTTTGLIVSTDTGDNGTYDLTWTINTDYLADPPNGETGGLTGTPYRGIQAVYVRRFPIAGLRPRVQVTAKWGWAATPEPVAQACLIKAARIYRRAQTPEGFSAGEAFGAVRVSSREDPDMTLLLGPYRRNGGNGLVVA